MLGDPQATENSLLHSQATCSMLDASSHKGLLSESADSAPFRLCPILLLVPTYIRESQQHLSESHEALEAKTPFLLSSTLYVLQSEHAQSPTARPRPFPDASQAMRWWVLPIVRPRSEPPSWAGSDGLERDRACMSDPGLYEGPHI